MAFLIGKELEMIEKLKKVINFILRYYNSLALVMISIWLGTLLTSVDHAFIGGLLIFISLLKLFGMLLDNVKMRIIGLICLNAMWAINTTIFIMGQHPRVDLPFIFPLFVLIMGLGVAIRGRFDE